MIAAVKVAVPLAYFAHDPTGAFHLRDDLGYFYDALRTVSTGPEGSWLYATLVIPRIVESAQVPHVFYNLWNILSMLAFGPHYFSPVFFNVATTFAAGYLFFRVLREAGFAESYARLASVFFLLHWDLLAWSSFLNLKDILVLTLTLASLLGTLVLLRRPTPPAFLGLAAPMAALLFLRFYVPLLIALAVLLHLLAHRRYLGAGLVLACVGSVASLKISLVGRILPFVRPIEAFTGVPRFLLTPLPWNLSPGYEFLAWPAWLHLLLLVPALLAIPSLRGKSSGARLLLMYLGVVVLAYAVIPDLQGPRQRFQIFFLFAWMQFHALRGFARHAFPFSGAAASHRDAPRLAQGSEQQA